MGNFSFSVPSLGNKFIDYRDPILGDSYNWHWVRPLTQVTYLTIHHSAGPDTQTPDDLASYHVNSRGWGGIGYHFVIDKFGKVFYVGDLTTARAHVLDYNHLALGICLIGSFINGKVPTDAQVVSAHELCAQLLFRTPEIPGVNGWEDVVGHQNLGATACPGDTWTNWRSKLVEGGTSFDTTQRSAEISNLYQVIFGRSPDQAGLNAYVQSNLTIDEIRKSMIESQEHKEILNRAKNFSQAKALAGESLTSLSQARTKVESITSLGQ